MQKWWQELDSRERMLIMVIGAVLVLALYFSAVWYPIHAARGRAEQRLTHSQSDLMWMRSASTELKRLSALSPKARTYDGTLLTLIGETAGKSNMGSAIKKLDPEGSLLARVTVEKAIYTDFMRWLVLMHNDYGVRVVNAGLRKGGLAGTVDGEITLEVSSK